MNNARGFWTIVTIIVLVIIVGVVIYEMNDNAMNSAPSTATTQNITALFSCDAGKSINATFMNATSATTTGNSVMLALSDGRQMTLPQTISADGARYSNGNPQIPDGQPGAETFIFWNKGNTAFVQENGTTTYSNCVDQNTQ